MSATHVSRALAAAVLLVFALAACSNSVEPTVEDRVDEVAGNAVAVVDQALGDAGDVAEQVQEQIDELVADVVPTDKPQPDGQVEEIPADEPAPELAGGRFAIAAIDGAAAALRHVVGSDDLELLEVTLTQGGRIAIQVRDPDIPENVDRYEWNGNQLGDSVPVHLTGAGELDDNVFPIAELSSAGAQAAFDAATAQDIEDGEVASMSLRINPFDGLAWGVPVSGSRSSIVLYASASGDVLRVV